MRCLLCAMLVLGVAGYTGLALAAGAEDCGYLGSRSLLTAPCYAVSQDILADGTTQPQPDHKRGREPIRVAENEPDKVTLSPERDHGPKHPFTHYNRGLANCDADRNKRAIANLDRAIELDANFAQAYHLRGILYYEMDDFRNAFSDLNLSLLLDPKNPHAQIYRDRSGLCLRGKDVCHGIRGNRCDWSEYYGRALGSSPVHGVVGYFLKGGGNSESVKFGRYGRLVK